MKRSFTIFKFLFNKKKYENALAEINTHKGLRNSQPCAMPLDGIALWLENGTLNLVPEYQRGYVWDAGKASRLVVTALCDRVVPSVTFHHREDGVYDVVETQLEADTHDER